MNGYVFTQDPHGWESFLDGVPEFSKFFPLIEEIKISTYIKGLSNYTPDGNFVLGALPSLDGFLAATGCAGAGIAMSGGIGRLVAELGKTGRTLFVRRAPSHRPLRFDRPMRFGLVAALCGCPICKNYRITIECVQDSGFEEIYLVAN